MEIQVTRLFNGTEHLLCLSGSHLVKSVLCSNGLIFDVHANNEANKKKENIKTNPKSKRRRATQKKLKS